MKHRRSIRKSAWIRLYAAGLAAAIAVTATAQDDESADSPSIPGFQLTDDFEFRVLAGPWFARARGKTSLAGSGGAVRPLDLKPELNLGSSETIFDGEIDITRDRWRITLGAFTFDTSGGGDFEGPAATFGPVNLTSGDAYLSDFEMDSFSFDVQYEYPLVTGPPISDGRPRVEMTLNPLIGWRYVDVEMALTEVGGASVDTGGSWGAPMFGVGVDMRYRPDGRIPLLDEFRMHASVAAGPALGGDGGSAWQVRGGVTLQFHPNVGVLVGYRLTEVDVENDGFDFDGGLQGLFIAASIQF